MNELSKKPWEKLSLYHGEQSNEHKLKIMIIFSSGILGKPLYRNLSSLVVWEPFHSCYSRAFFAIIIAFEFAKHVADTMKQISHENVQYETVLNNICNLAQIPSARLCSIASNFSTSLRKALLLNLHVWSLGKLHLHTFDGAPRHWPSRPSRHDLQHNVTPTNSIHGW